MRRTCMPLLALMLAFSLASCKGVGLSNMSTDSAFEDSAEEKAEDTWWDRMYGRKGLERESKEWKDFYKAPNQDDTKPDYCGFWGNCAAENSKAPANCNFYGNCTAEDRKQGWW